MSPGRSPSDLAVDRAVPVSATPSIWAFIAADCFSFAIFFAVFMSERLGKASLFDESARRLDARLGLLNTLILICSSGLVAAGVAAAQKGDLSEARRWLWRGVIVGGGFGVVKIVEYSSKVLHGLTPLTNDFFMFYYALTGVHFLHYLIGLAVLFVLIRKTRSATIADSNTLLWINSGGIYWHMVDLLWVFLFPMLYLLGGR